MKKDCLKMKNWFEKKGDHLSLVCFEINLVNVPFNIWWLDSGATIHVSNFTEGLLTTQSLNKEERTIVMGS